MTKQEQEVNETIRMVAEEQVLFLKSRFEMAASDIITLYTGKAASNATYGDAIHSIMTFNSIKAKQQGFIA